VKAVTKSSIAFDFPTRNRLFEALKNGKSLELETPNESYYFDLTEFRRAFEKLFTCLQQGASKAVAGKTAKPRRPATFANDEQRRKAERSQAREFLQIADWQGDWNTVYSLFEDAFNLSVSLDQESAALLNGDVSEDYAVSNIEDVRFRMRSRLNQAKRALHDLPRPTFKSGDDRQAAGRLIAFLEDFATTMEKISARSEEIADRIMNGQSEVALSLLQEKQGDYLDTLERSNFLLTEQVRYIDEATPKYHLFNSMLQINLAMMALVKGSISAAANDYAVVDKEITETRRALSEQRDHVSSGRGRVDALIRQMGQMNFPSPAKSKLLEALQSFYESFQIEEAIAKILMGRADAFTQGDYRLDTFNVVDELMVRRNTLIALRGRRIEEYWSYFK
jgi:hypothetical protein